MSHRELSDTTAVILAGGLGTRLQSVVADRPKALAKIGGRPFLSYLFDQLLTFRIGKTVVCTGFRGEQVQEEFGSSYKTLGLSYSHETRPLGTAGALRNALPQLSGDQFLVLNGDSYCDADMGAFWKWHLSKGSSVSLLLTVVPDAGRYGRVETDTCGRIVRFVEKGGGGPGSVNAGIYILRRRCIFTIPEGEPVSLERRMFPEWRGRGMYGHVTDGRFLDIGTPEDYARAEKFFIDRRDNDNK